MTTVAIVGVVLAGAAAVAANVGILSAADDSDLGELSAVTVAPQVVDVYVTDPAATSSTTATTVPTGTETVQDFVVDVAGTATIVSTPSSIGIAGLAPAPGWTATPTASTASAVTAEFTDGIRVLSFRAELAPNGDVQASVTDVTPVAAPAPASAASSGGTQYEDDDDDDEWDDDEWDDDESDDDESDDDDDEEHEGRDDDD